MKRIPFYVTAIVLLTLFAACSKDDGDDLKITSSRNVELISKKTSQIECSDSKATYSSENEYVATVSSKSKDHTCPECNKTLSQKTGKRSTDGKKWEMWICECGSKYWGARNKPDFSKKVSS